MGAIGGLILGYVVAFQSPIETELLKWMLVMTLGLVTYLLVEKGYI